jgi:hypothetical protein
MCLRIHLGTTVQYIKGVSLSNLAAFFLASATESSDVLCRRAFLRSLHSESSDDFSCPLDVGGTSVVSSPFCCSASVLRLNSIGSITARSMATGNPLWRPRIMTKHTISFDSGVKAPEKEKFCWEKMKSASWLLAGYKSRP